MKRVERSEVLDIGAYEPLREAFRRRIIELKRARRVQLGANITALFENHDTVLYQIQEMLRTERITREDAILHEIETYNELIPAPSELSVTLFLEYPERVQREEMLVELEGIENLFYFAVGEHRVSLRNETRGVLPGRTTAVQYAKVPLTPPAVEALRGGRGPAVLGVTHRSYTAHVELSPRMVEELASDLT